MAKKGYVPLTEENLDYLTQYSQAFRNYGWKDMRVFLHSLCPLLMDNPEIKMGQGVETAGQRKLTKEEEAEMAVYKNANDQLYFPTDGVYKATLEAAKSAARIKNRGVNTIMQAATWFSPPLMLLEHKDGSPVQTWGIDTRRVVNKAKGAVLGSRPLVPEWYASIIVQYSDTIDPVNVILREIARGGLTVGIGAYRIKTAEGKRGIFGAYEVVKAEFLQPSGEWTAKA